MAQPAQAVAQVDAKIQEHVQKISLATNGVTDFGATEMSRVRRRCLSLPARLAAAPLVARGWPGRISVGRAACSGAAVALGLATAARV